MGFNTTLTTTAPPGRPIANGRSCDKAHESNSTPVNSILSSSNLSAVFHLKNFLQEVAVMKLPKEDENFTKCPSLEKITKEGFKDNK